MGQNISVVGDFIKCRMYRGMGEKNVGEKVFDLLVTSLETPSGHSPTLWHFLVYEPEGKWNNITWPTHGDKLPGDLLLVGPPPESVTVIRRLGT